MAFKDKLPVSYLLFTARGRISRSSYWTASIFTWSAFYTLYNVLEYLFSYSATIFIYPIVGWILVATAIKRLHDSNFSGYWLWVILVPVLGPLWLFYLLGLRRGQRHNNPFGPDPKAAPDYFKNGVAENTVDAESKERIVNDITRLNPVIVAEAVAPATLAELQEIIKNTNGHICVGGGRFSMGGQTASAGSLHIDMRKLNKVVDFSTESKTVKVEAGIRWCDIQHFVDAHNLSVKIMQTYANFTVGGSLSVNCHGRYIGLGPLILSVRALEIILANGERMRVSKTDHAELFYACIGCYNAIAVIATVELDLADNIAVERVSKMMKITDYRSYFSRETRDNTQVIFHNGDIYPPAFKSVRAVSWIKTGKKPTEKTRLMPLAASYPLERYFIGAFSKGSFGKWRRQHIYDPILFYKKKVHWRNYEAGYDVAELEPRSRIKTTYVLQEYFVPVGNFDEFSILMKEIFSRHKVNVINVSIRHALADTGSLMAWARQEVFAFVVWYKQKTGTVEKNKVGIWTRELIGAALSLDGAYYLPYQVHATPAQFHQAYPNARKLFELKAKLDPHYKFRNVVWDTYYQPKKI